MSEYFLKPKSLQTNVIVELDLPNYATKTDFKNAAGVDTSSSANLKSDLDKLDIDKVKMYQLIKATSKLNQINQMLINQCLPC